MIHWLPKVGVPERGKQMELPEGYTLEEVENGARVLKRAGRYALVAFGNEANPENIRRVAEADKAYLETKKLDGRYTTGGDPESSLMMSGEDIKEARKRYLLALEAAYRQ
jgi:hypothetical protein